MLTPDLYVKKLAHVPLEQLAENGYKGLVIDLDNTVTEWNSKEVRPDVVKWFWQLKEFNFRVCLVSNNDESRVLTVAEQLGIPYIFKAGKPRQKAFRKAMQVLGTSFEETAVIGDQIFTDVLGANRLQLFSILVIPLSKREFMGTKFMRRLEKMVLRKLAVRDGGGR